MNNNSKYGGMIKDLPEVTGGHFIEGSVKKIVFGPEQFWEDYVMRFFDLNPGAASEPHSHPWAHWSVCINGKGTFTVDGVIYDLCNGAYVHVPDGIVHNFQNTSETEQLELLCIVPKAGDVNPLAKGLC